ncbi:hypothetical protein [Rhodoluna limnophila]|uniref:hypothetical protein n=1 Tax=Rhodoluna limnophila TaxID=232537 RepID=UPI00110612D8|nr:hypothetical protein [Rhodoluna limnophila]
MNPEEWQGAGEPDEAVQTWGGEVKGKVAIRKSGPIVKHIPFYKFPYYPDVLDLRKCGYEIDAFAQLFDLLDGAHVRHAQVAHILLHLPTDEFGRMGDGAGGNPLWNPRRARELEFQVRAALHRYGLSDVPTLLRRMIGKAFPGDSMTHISVDLLNVFFWAALAKVARDYAWRDERLEFMAEYLEYPVRRAFRLG